MFTLALSHTHTHTHRETREWRHSSSMRPVYDVPHSILNEVDSERRWEAARAAVLRKIRRSASLNYWRGYAWMSPTYLDSRGMGHDDSVRFRHRGIYRADFHHRYAGRQRVPWSHLASRMLITLFVVSTLYIFPQKCHRRLLNINNVTAMSVIFSCSHAISGGTWPCEYRSYPSPGLTPVFSPYL